MRLWALLEAARAELDPDMSRARQALADTAAVQGAFPGFLVALGGLCSGLPPEALAALDRVVERKLWEIDRAEVHAVIVGSDDGFLYARGFTLAIGREFYRCVVSDPQMCVPWAECEEICYFFAHLHHQRFEFFPETGSGISRESGQNVVGWLS